MKNRTSRIGLSINKYVRPATETREQLPSKYFPILGLKQTKAQVSGQILKVTGQSSTAVVHTLWRVVHGSLSLIPRQSPALWKTGLAKRRFPT